MYGRDAHLLTTETQTQADGSSIHVVEWADDSQPVTFDGGELAALVRLRDEVMPEKMGQIDTLASTIVQQINALHQQGTGAGPYATAVPSPQVAFFDATKLTATTMALDPVVQVDTQAIAAAGTPSNGPGDNTNALAIAALRQATFSALGGVSFNDFHASNVAAVGAETRQAEQIAANQKALTDHLSARRESLSGVSLDEEATSLIRYQRAYQAAARGITTMDEMLETIISRMGRAGL